MFQQINLPLTDKFNALSLRSSTNSSSFQQSSMPMNGLQMPKQQIIPPPTSPTAKRIAAEKRVRERRNAFKMGGKSRSLGNAEKNILSVLAPSSPPIRMPNLARRSESMNRHQLNPAPRNGMGGGQIRKSSDSIYGIGGGKRNNQIVPMDGGGDAISAPSQHIIQFCLDNSRGDLSARVLNRMAHKRPDFALFCANLGVELWTQLGDQFRQFLADVVANLASTEKIRQFSMAFGSAQVNWRSFGFKADFFAEMASALTTECVFLDGAAHPPTDAFEAWAELVELMFSAVRDGYYSQVRQLRRNHFSLGYSQSVMAKRGVDSGLIGNGGMRQHSHRGKGHSSLEI